ncbi:MAG: polyprenyl diphosphate synthase [Chloroflexota bacterium]|nr:polyprenyl diphosphate synthase [Chloroflexota bacterium]
MINQESTPDHVAIIMDGNGRWATSKGKLRTDGHKAGTENLRRIIRAFSDAGVSYLTLYAFSTENWNRPQPEVQFLLEILTEIIVKETVNLHKEGVQIKHLGRLDRLSTELQSAITKSVEMTRDNQGITLSGAFDYGGRTEILDAVKGIMSDKIAPDKLSDGLFRQYLYTDDMPDPDLIIRTAGEMRISNFLLWQSAYAEYYTTNVLWPDFDEIEVKKALKEYAKRSRKFGNIPELESP